MSGELDILLLQPGLDTSPKAVKRIQDEDLAKLQAVLNDKGGLKLKVGVADGSANEIERIVAAIERAVVKTGGVQIPADIDTTQVKRGAKEIEALAKHFAKGFSSKFEIKGQKNLDELEKATREYLKASDEISKSATRENLLDQMNASVRTLGPSLREVNKDLEAFSKHVNKSKIQMTPFGDKADYERMRKQINPTGMSSQSGTPMDTWYDEARSLFPGLLPDVTHVEEQFDAVLKLMRDFREQKNALMTDSELEWNFGGQEELDKSFDGIIRGLDSKVQEINEKMPPIKPRIEEPTTENIRGELVSTTKTYNDDGDQIREIERRNVGLGEELKLRTSIKNIEGEEVRETITDEIDNIEKRNVALKAYADSIDQLENRLIKFEANRKDLLDSDKHIVFGNDILDKDGNSFATKAKDFSERLEDIKKHARDLNLEAGFDENAFDPAAVTYLTKRIELLNAELTECSKNLTDVGRQSRIDTRSAVKENDMEKYRSRNRGFLDQNKELEESLNKIVELNSKVGNRAELEEVNRQYKLWHSNVEKLKAASSKPFDAATAQTKLTQDLEMFKARYSSYKGNPELVKQVEALDAAIKSLSSQADSDKIKLDMRQLNADTVVAGRNMKSLGDQLTNAFRKFGLWTGASFITMRVIREIREAVNTLKEMDTTLTNLSKVTSVTREEFKELGLEALEVASRYGRSVNDMLQAQVTFARAGEENYKDWAEVSLIAQAAGYMDEEAASKYLIASDKAFGFGGDIEKITALLDAQNQVSNRHAITLQFLADATRTAYKHRSFNVNPAQGCAA